MKLSKKINCILTAALAVSMAFSSYALADDISAKEELEEILAVLAEKETAGLLSGDLAFDQLLDAIDDNGLQFVMDMGLTEETAATLGMEGEIPEDGRVVMTTVIDPKLKKWMFDTTVHADGEEFVDLSFYADKDILSVASSALYSGAIGIRSGSFKEQFEGSALQRLLEIEGEIPDFNLKFFPDDDDFVSVPVSYDMENLEEQAERIEEGMRVEKAETDGQTIYTAYIQTEDIMEIYDEVMDLYIDFFVQAGLLTAYDVEEFNAEWDSMLGQMELLLGEEIAVDYYTQNGQLLKCAYEMVVDPSVIEPVLEEEVNYAQDLAEEETGIMELDASMEVSDEGGIISYEILFPDPANPYQNFDVIMTAADLSGSDTVVMNMSKTTETTENGERSEISLEVSEMGEVLYAGTPMWMEYNSKTGDLDAAFEVDDGYETVALRLDSTIAKEAGKYIEWQIDDISMEVDGEAIGVQGSVLISSEPEEIVAPENMKMILELEDGELVGVLMEIMYNVEALVAVPEEEYTDYAYSEVTTADAI